jgi:hypothetical protein
VGLQFLRRFVERFGHGDSAAVAGRVGALEDFAQERRDGFGVLAREFLRVALGGNLRERLAGFFLRACRPHRLPHTGRDADDERCRDGCDCREGEFVSAKRFL